MDEHDEHDEHDAELLELFEQLNMKDEMDAELQRLLDDEGQDGGDEDEPDGGDSRCPHCLTIDLVIDLELIEARLQEQDKVMALVNGQPNTADLYARRVSLLMKRNHVHKHLWLVLVQRLMEGETPAQIAMTAPLLTPCKVMAVVNDDS